MEKKMFFQNGIYHWRPKNLAGESALKISFELKRQKNRPSLWKREILRRPVVAYGTINFKVGLLRMTYFNIRSAISKLELLKKALTSFSMTGNQSRK
jgi:hypothetical protein